MPDSGVPIAVQSANNLMRTLPRSIAVIRKNDEQLKDLLSATGIEIVENPDVNSGLSSSIRYGIEHLNRKTGTGGPLSGYLIALADMPFISPETIKLLVDVLTQGHLICAPQFQNKRGHPVGFSAKLESELLSLQGDIGAKTLIDKYSESLQIVPVTDEAVLRDVDSVDDLKIKSR